MPRRDCLFITILSYGMPRPQQHEFLPATGEDFNALALEGDEAMEEDMEQEGYGMYHELIAFTSFLSVSLYM